MSTLNETIAKCIGKLVRMFSSTFENERYVALAKLKGVLDEEGLTFSDIATVIENCNGEIEQLKYSDTDARAIFARGIEKGRAEQRACALSAQFFDDNGIPRWSEMARFCESNPAKSTLKPNEQEFVDEMQVKLRYRAPTRAMGGFLLSIFWKLGGSFK